MKVVILGGNECMERRYKDLCEEYNCRAKVFCKLKNNFCSKIGNPDLLVLFVGTMSHKMLRCAMCEYRRSDTVVVHAPSASLSSLRSIMDEHCRQAKYGGESCRMSS